MEGDQRIQRLSGFYFHIFNLTLFFVTFLKVLKETDLDFLSPSFVYISHFCVSYILGIDFLFTVKVHKYGSIFSCLRDISKKCQQIVSINQFPNDTLDVEGLRLTPAIWDCMLTVQAVCTCDCVIVFPAGYWGWYSHRLCAPVPSHVVLSRLPKPSSCEQQLSATWLSQHGPRQVKLFSLTVLSCPPANDIICFLLCLVPFICQLFC